jgi:hypothetical protein
MLPVKTWWKDLRERRTILLLVILFIVFFGLHAWASLAKNYCVFCFPTYITFFLPIGLLISILTFSNLIEKRQRLPVILVVLFMLIIIPGLFLGSLETIGRGVMTLPFPRLKGGQILPGSVPMWTVFGNRFGQEFDQLLPIIPPIFGFASAAAVVIIFALIHKFFKLKKWYSLGSTFAIGTAILGLALTPTFLMGNDLTENICGGDFIAAFEEAGMQLAKVIPDGAKVYWGGESVSTPLLYITGAELHLPQLNGIYSARRGGDRDLLEKAGYFNDESRQAWRESDEFFLIKYSSMGDFWKEFLNEQEFSEFKPTVSLDPCDPNASIRIYRRSENN